MDEPLAALDAPRRREILPFLERLNQSLRIPILYVTHSAEEVMRLADDLVLMNEGRIVAQGPLSELGATLELPEELTKDFGGVVHGSCLAFDSEYGLIDLQFCGGILRIPHTSVPIGTRLRARLRSTDIALTLSKPNDSSVLNFIPARIIEQVRCDGDSHVRIRLDAGGAPLVARLTRYSFDRLQLKPGLAVWAQIKAAAILT